MEMSRQNYADNREYKLQYYKDHYQEIKEDQKAYYQERYDANPELRKQIAENSRQWRQDNSDGVAAQCAHRRARKLEATPNWADLKAIAEIYTKCAEITKRTGIKHQVDHIIPLTSDLVCGLHVESNLQILTADENNKKNNSFDPDEFETTKNPA